MHSTSAQAPDRELGFQLRRNRATPGGLSNLDFFLLM